MPVLSRPEFVTSNSRLLNALMFQLGWFSCVLGGDLIAAAVTTVILLVHGRWFVNGKKEWLLIAAVTCLGTAVDSLWVYSAILTFPEAITYTPVWLACIWVVFATSLCHSLQWLQQRLLLACVLGAIAGPSSYLGGAALAGVEIAEPRLLSFAVIALAWAIIMPIILMLARRVSDD